MAFLFQSSTYGNQNGAARGQGYNLVTLTVKTIREYVNATANANGLDRKEAEGFADDVFFGAANNRKISKMRPSEYLSIDRDELRESWNHILDASQYDDNFREKMRTAVLYFVGAPAEEHETAYGRSGGFSGIGNKNDPINNYDDLVKSAREAVYSVKAVGFGKAVVTIDGEVLNIELSPSVSEDPYVRVEINRALLDVINKNPNSIFSLGDNSMLNIGKDLSGDAKNMIYQINKK